MTDEQPPEDLSHAGAVVDKAIEYMIGQNIGALSIASALLGGAMALLARSVADEAIVQILNNAIAECAERGAARGGSTVRLTPVRAARSLSLGGSPSMLTIEPSGKILGATVRGADLRQDLSREDFAAVLRALGEHGVLCFPGQALEAAELRRFSSRFGDIQVIKGIPHHEPGMPEVTILSNVKVNGKLIGAPDAGQSWHTDMTYAKTMGFVNVLSAFKVPMRDGRALGGTEFTNTQAAAADLPVALIERLARQTATHDIEYYWEYMRREKGSKRPPLTDEQRRQRPPVHHPVLLTHPITGRRVIYVNPGFTVRIDGVSDAESAELLRTLLDHVLQPKYRYVHEWTVGDLLLWDHIGTWHYARPDYGPDEHRLMKRCQVMATRIFDSDFLREALMTEHAAMEPAHG